MQQKKYPHNFQWDVFSQNLEVIFHFIDQLTNDAEIRFTSTLLQRKCFFIGGGGGGE